jgi:hypothetical protein
VTPFVRTQLGFQKGLIIVFYIYDADCKWSIAKRQEIQSKLFHLHSPPGVRERKTTIIEKNAVLPFPIHVNDSACHNGHKITSQLTVADIARASHPPYSPDLSPWDFWLFGFLNESIEGMELSIEDQIVEAITTTWRRVTFGTLQSVFQEWMHRVNWVSKKNGDYYFE